MSVIRITPRSSGLFHPVSVAGALLAASLLAGAASADMGGSGQSWFKPTIDRAVAAVEKGDYRKAAGLLEKHLDKNPKDADALNLMGFSLRKMEKYEQSEQYYLRALEVEPEHLGANEYLGELYLQTGRPALARERLAVLERACPNSCEEREELKAALGSYSGNQDP